MAELKIDISKVVEGAVKEFKHQGYYVSKWTSVDKALPEKDGYYLVVKESEICESIDIAEYSENRWHKHDKVTHWQPLPELPETTKG